MADFFWCMMAAQRGHSIEDVAARLLEVSGKAQENARPQARQGVEPSFVSAHAWRAKQDYNANSLNQHKSYSVAIF